MKNTQDTAVDNYTSSISEYDRIRLEQAYRDMLRDRPDNRKSLVIHDAALRSGFTQIPNCVLRDSRLSAMEKIVYSLLLSYAWQNNECYPGTETLAYNAGCTIRTVISAIQGLTKAKLIKVERRGQGKVNIYHIRNLQDAYPQIVDRSSGG